MQLISRRNLLKGLLAATGASVSLGGYAVAEPWRLNVTRYSLKPPGWTPGLKLRVALVADLHACDPWMPESRIRQIVARTNALAPDAILLLGDYVAGRGLMRYAKPMSGEVWAGALADLKAPLGVHAVLGNHDWWEDLSVQARRSGPPPAEVALKAAGIRVYGNDAVRLEKDGKPFWIAGLGDQWAFFRKGTQSYQKPRSFDGVDDLPGTLAKITDNAPVVLMAHEPDIFPVVPDRVSLTVCGHTHGGQITFAGYAPVVPSRYGRRYLYGHIVEQQRNLIVSGGLGCSGLPLRLGVPPEIVVVDLGTEHPVA